jgi:serine O-acetyltransferase
MNPLNILKVKRLHNISRKFYLKKFYKVSRAVDSLSRFINKCAVYGETDIGSGTQFAYGGIAVVIHKHAIIGKNCMIGQCSTIGRVHGKGIEIPIIEDNVYIGAGAKILGGVVVGHNSIIAPNAVITKDVKPFSVMTGVPGRLLTSINSDNFERYAHYGIEKLDD